MTLSRRLAAVALAATALLAPGLAHAQRGGLTIAGHQTAALRPVLFCRDAPIPPATPNPPFNPSDPSVALAFNSTINGVNLNGVGQLWTPIPDGGGFYA